MAKTETSLLTNLVIGGVAVVLIAQIWPNGPFAGIRDTAVSLWNQVTSSESAITATPPAESVSPLDNPDGTKPGLGSIAAGSIAAAVALINSVPTAGRGPKTGYDRACTKGHACVFGPAWTDNTTAPLSHDGCDTRNNILARDAKTPTFKTGQTCKVISAAIFDPYDGKLINFNVSDASAVQIDHVYSLSFAWQMGAAGWPLPKREAFANDPLDLLAVDGPANLQKSDSGPAAWLPANTTIRCAYATRIAQVALKYQLPLPTPDKQAALKQCR